MDSPNNDNENDEVIADSEDEGNGLHLQEKSNAAYIPQATTQDTILTGFNTNRTISRPLSTCDDPKTPAIATLARPRPRPIMKTIQTHDTNLFPDPDPTLSSISNGTEFSNIADRAKMRSRAKASQHEPTSTIIELSSDGDDFNLVPPSKKRRTATARRKTSASAKATGESASEVDNINPKPRPRPRPRPIGNAKAGALSDPITPFSLAMDTSLSAISSVSDKQGPIPFKLILSQLPPSDPPISTPSSSGYPPIETLPQSSTDPGHPSSPSSLFSAYSHDARRGHTATDIDELASDQGPQRMDIDVRSMPPPTFFAGSPSPAVRDTASGGRRGQSPPIKAPARKKSRKKQVIQSDDDKIETTGEKSLKQSKTKRRVTKKVEVVIEELNKRRKKRGNGKKKVLIDQEIVNGDDDDDMNLFRNAPRTNGGLNEKDLFNSLSSLSESENGDTMEAGPSKQKFSHRNNVHSDRPEVRGNTTTGKRDHRVESDEEDSNVQKPEFSLVKNTDAITKGKVADTKNNMEESNKEKGEKSPEGILSKENAQPGLVMRSGLETPTDAIANMTPSLTSRYTITSKSKPTPMSDLIRRVNSKPGSPFCSPVPRSATPGTAYSPYAKASRKALSRIAPLHANRRTPPPPLPPPPPRKKTKKELEREEQWEEELIESVGGITEWACMTDAERKELRKAKMEKEMHGWED